jgi:hypothetical protein
MLIGTPLFGMKLDREPPTLGEFPYGRFWQYLNTWVQDAGGFAAVGLAVLAAVHLVLTLINAGRPKAAYRPPTYLVLLTVLAGVAVTFYAVGGVLFLVNPVPVLDLTAGPDARVPLTAVQVIAYGCYTVGGLAGLVGFALPLLYDVPRLRFRRIYALARLSVLEAFRSRLLWSFLLFLLVFLFPVQWFYQLKPEDEVRTSVTVVYWAMTPMLLLAASLLAAFSLPTDIRNQTIHTITTKPVERFEIVLGRFLGYVALATMILLGLTLVSLLFLRLTRFSPQAARETFKARVPLYAPMQFRDLRKPDEKFEGENVGREDEYRRYIAGGNPNPFRAVWEYRDAELRTPVFSPALKDQPSVPVEFAFDIFRTTKGKQEGEAVTCSFTVVSWKWGTQFGSWPEVKDKRVPEAVRPTDRASAVAYRDVLKGAVAFNGQTIKPLAQPDNKQYTKQDWEAIDKLAEQYGIYQYTGKPIRDYHTETLHIPAGLIRNAMDGTPPKDANGRSVPRLMVIVQCDSPTQFLGVAKADLWLLASDGWFDLNFIKGTAGLWLRLCLVIGVAVVLSTYLSGPVSWLVAGALFLMGRGQEFIVEVAKGNQQGGGGPFQSAYRLLNGETAVAPLSDTPGAKIAQSLDPVFEFGLRRILNFIPDVNSYDWTPYVTNGFNIDAGDLFLTTLFLAGYLLPWGLLGYHLIKSREIAG